MEIRELSTIVKTIMKKRIKEQEISGNVLSGFSETDLNVIKQEILEAYHCTSEQANEKLRTWEKESNSEIRQSKVKWTGIFLIEAALVLFLIAVGRFAFAAVALLLMVITGVVYCGKEGNQRKMNKMWEERDKDERSIRAKLDSMKFICNDSSLATCSKAGKLFLVMGLVCVIALFAVYVVRYPVHKKVIRRLENVASYEEDVNIEGLFAELQRKEALAELNCVIDGMRPEWDNYIKAALLICDLTESEIITPEDMDELFMRVLPDIQVGKMIRYKDECKALLRLMDVADGRLRNLLEEEIGKEYINGEVRTNSSLNDFMGEIVTRYYSKADGLTEAMQAYLRYGCMNEFLQTLQKHVSDDQFLEFLKSDNEHDLKVPLAQIVCKDYRQPDEVLSFLALARKHGLTAEECYPDGAVLEWDLMHLDRYAFDGLQEMPDCWLPVIRTEREEKKEGKRVPDTLRSVGDDYTPVWDSTYKSNDALGKDAFTITLDTHILSAMDPEKIPETIDEVDGVLLHDTLYPRMGSIRITTTNTLAGRTQSSYQTDYPVYHALQRYSVYSFASPNTLYLIAYHGTEPKDTEKFNSFSDIEDFCLAKPDSNWASDTGGRIYEELMANQWDLKAVSRSDEEIEAHALDMLSQLLLAYE